MSEKTREVPQLSDATYAHTLVIESSHEIIFTDSFTMQTLSSCLHCILNVLTSLVYSSDITS